MAHAKLYKVKNITKYGLRRAQGTGEFRFNPKKEEKMSQEQLEKPIINGVKEEGEKVPATERGIDAAEDKEKGVVADASGGQVRVTFNVLHT